MQRYKIYINESPLLLTQASDLADETEFERSLIHAVYSGKPKMLMNYIELLEKNKHHEGIIIQADNVAKLWADFKSLYNYIKAGGGIVVNQFGKVLLIFRRGVWDLPKGKQDPGETLAQTALREVREETGLTDLKIIEKLNNGYRSEEHTSELQSQSNLVCRLLLEKKKK